ncbi:MAG: pilus assembly protein PilM [bacterium]
MGLFSSNKTSYLGVDLGSSSIKVVELANSNGRPRLVTYGFTEKKLTDNNFISSSDFLNAEDEIAKTLMEVCNKSRTFSKKAVAALPSFAVFTSILNLPEMSKKELASAITWEAKKIIPMPLEEVILDWKIISQEEYKNEDTKDPAGEGDNQQLNPVSKIFSHPTKGLKILLTGASKSLVRKYVNIFNTAGVSLLSLETENFALVRSLIGNDQAVIMIVDLGANSSSIMVAEKGIPVMARSVEMGGTLITKAISSSLNVNLDRAEQFKQDMMLETNSASNSLPQTVEKAFATILNEIKYTVGLYQEQHNQKIEKIILTGGSANLGNLTGYLSKVLNINAYVGDPWARVIYPVELKPILDRLGSRFSVAIGLAMRNIE